MALNLVPSADAADQAHSPPPKKLPIDLNEIKTRQGSWRILVESVVDAQAGFNLLFKMILESPHRGQRREPTQNGRPFGRYRGFGE
jgi:hypothetical protein